MGRWVGKTKNDSSLEGSLLPDYRAVFDALDAAILIIDPETGAIVDVNQKTCALYGCVRDEAIGMGWLDLVDPVFPPQCQEEASFRTLKVMNEGPQLVEWLTADRSGRTFWAEVSLKLVGMGENRFMAAAIRDISERKQAERELAGARDYLKTVFNNIHDAVFIHDANGTVIDVNKKMLDMYQVSHEEALRFSIAEDYTAPEGRPDMFSVWKSVLAGNDEFLECRGRRPKDGYEFEGEVYMTRLSLPEGDYVLASIRDITDRKRVERELTAAKDYLRAVFNNIHDAVLLHDASGRVVDVNETMLRLYRISREEAIGLSIVDDYSAPDEPELLLHQPALWQKVMNGEPQFFEWKARRPEDGSVFDVEVSLTKLSLPDGDYVLACDRDITERNAEKLKFQKLSERSPVAMVMMEGDERLRFKYVNPKFEDLFGSGISDMHEWATRAYPGPVFRRRAGSRLINALKALKPGADKSFIRKVSAKSGVQKDVKFTPVRLQTGEILMTCLDITKNREVERRIRERNLALEILNDIMASTTRSLHSPEILQALKRVLVEKMRVEAGGILFYSDAEGRMGLEVCWGVPESAKREFEAFALACYREGTIIHEDDVTLVRHRPDWYESRFAAPFRDCGWRAYLCISLFLKGEMSGMIFLTGKNSDSFSDDQGAFYKTLGQQIRVAVQNARLFEALQDSHAGMKALSLRLVRVQEAERRHVARELHDEIGQLLTGLKLSLEMASQESETQSSNLSRAKALANTITGLVRELSRRLRPSMLDDLGLLPTLPWLFERFSSQTNIQVAFEHSHVENKRFLRELETAVYRIAQEALTNVARHAKVDRVTVRLWHHDKTLGLQIEDRGVGFDSRAVSKAASNGLNGMRERVMLLGGQFALETSPGSGVCLTVELPTDPEKQEG